MSVPVRNVYYLLCYAWDALDEAGLAAVEGLTFKTMPDLLAGVLAAGVEQLLKRGLDRSYVTTPEDTRTPKGKFDLSETLKRNLLMVPAVHCSVDTLEVDVPHNRVVKAALRQLGRCDGLDPTLRSHCTELYRRLPAVTDVPLTATAVARVQLHRNARHYRLLVDVCRLILHALLPDPGSGRTAFRDFLRDDRLMAALFERFVRTFYRREQNTFSLVGSERIAWEGVDAAKEAREYLPQMRTDVSLGSADRKLVIDCKYYSQTLGGYYDAQTLHSQHLYQIYAYIQNLTRLEPGRVIEGMLLYPTVNRELDLKYDIHGYHVRIVTIDLMRDWPVIHHRLLSLIEPW